MQKHKHLHGHRDGTELNNRLAVEVTDPPCAAKNRRFCKFTISPTRGKGPDPWMSQWGGPWMQEIKFHHGPISKDGPNGVSDETLLAILVERARHQHGTSKKEDLGKTEAVLHCLEDALDWMIFRTKPEGRTTE